MQSLRRTTKVEIFLTYVDVLALKCNHQPKIYLESLFEISNVNFSSISQIFPFGLRSDAAPIWQGVNDSTLRT